MYGQHFVVAGVRFSDRCPFCRADEPPIARQLRLRSCEGCAADREQQTLSSSLMVLVSCACVQAESTFTSTPNRHGSSASSRSVAARSIGRRPRIRFSRAQSSTFSTITVLGVVGGLAHGWSESLRQQLQPDVRVIVIEPGAVATELTDHITDAQTKAAAEQMYEANSIAPEDVAEIIALSRARAACRSTRSSCARPGRRRDDEHAQPPNPRGTKPTMTPTLQLNKGVQMPALGFRVFQSSPEETVSAVEAALSTGYRLIDTAAAYGNEREVGEAIRRSGVDRDEVFVTTKLWISDYGRDAALVGFDASLRRLGLDYVDLYLLHQPVPSDFEPTIAAYEAAEEMLASGRARAQAQGGRRASEGR